MTNCSNSKRVDINKFHRIKYYSWNEWVFDKFIRLTSSNAYHCRLVSGKICRYRILDPPNIGSLSKCMTCVFFHQELFWNQVFSYQALNKGCFPYTWTYNTVMILQYMESIWSTWRYFLIKWCYSSYTKLLNKLNFLKVITFFFFHWALPLLTVLSGPVLEPGKHEWAQWSWTGFPFLVPPIARANRKKSCHCFLRIFLELYKKLYRAWYKFAQCTFASY